MFLKVPQSYLCSDGKGLGYADGVGAICALWAWAVSAVQPRSRMCFSGGVARTRLCVRMPSLGPRGLSTFHLQSALPAGHALSSGCWGQGGLAGEGEGAKNRLEEEERREARCWEEQGGGVSVCVGE